MTTRKEKNKRHRIVHLVLACTWAALILPTVLWWKESILWVIIISIYANVAAHLAAYEGASE